MYMALRWHAGGSAYPARRSYRCTSRHDDMLAGRRTLLVRVFADEIKEWVVSGNAVVLEEKMVASGVEVYGTEYSFWFSR